MTFGSIPVIEDPSIHLSTKIEAHNGSGLLKESLSRKTISCDAQATFRLLKRYSPPVYWIKDWKRDLPPLIKLLQEQSSSDHYVQRERIRRWYTSFKHKMSKLFLNVVKHNFQLS